MDDRQTIKTQTIMKMTFETLSNCLQSLGFERDESNDRMDHKALLRDGIEVLFCEEDFNLVIIEGIRFKVGFKEYCQNDCIFYGFIENKKDVLSVVKLLRL